MCVIELPMARGRFLGLRTNTPSIAAVAGSFRTEPAANSGEVLLQRLVTTLLTCGTRRLDQFEMTELLDSRGARFSVDSAMRRVSFSARVCANDLDLVADLLAQCLTEPRFDTDDFSTERSRLIAALQFNSDKPAALANDALSRVLYSPDHPRYQPAVADQIAYLERLTVDDVRQYHRRHFNPDDLYVVVVGDIDPPATAATFDRYLQSWMPRSAPVPGVATPRSQSAQLVRLLTSGGGHYEVVLGKRLTIQRDHPDYMALRVANRILGGTFSSRLVAVIREQKGFTYSIRSELAEPDGVFDGHWQVALSLSPRWLEAGLDATRAEIERFANDGVSAPELATRQLETVSGFQVGLSTVGGSSQAILFGAERGFGADFIHDFAEKIQDITPAQLNRAIQLNLHPAGSHTVIVGPA